MLEIVRLLQYIGIRGSLSPRLQVGTRTRTEQGDSYRVGIRLFLAVEDNETEIFIVVLKFIRLLLMVDVI